MSAMERDCLICGQMICGGEECRGYNSLQTIYGLCSNCVAEVYDHMGTKYRRGRHDEQGFVLPEKTPQRTIARLRAKLEEWSRP